MTTQPKVLLVGGTGRELAEDPTVWDDWKGKLPVVVNSGAAAESR